MIESPNKLDIRKICLLNWRNCSNIIITNSSEVTLKQENRSDLNVALEAKNFSKETSSGTPLSLMKQEMQKENNEKFDCLNFQGVRDPNHELITDKETQSNFAGPESYGGLFASSCASDQFPRYYYIF